ncbi:copper homeostasis membrane protein CopD [Pseudomonas sp. B14-6]|jgi:putative copper resistance protein D|uniref:Copper resistance protein D n=3 Tax=Pseudomonas TaxID=286 RepID=A0AB36CT45_9PSED|nr:MULTISPECIES: copper homeostasis membrane protein CopD [Pseudomonas]AHZ72665.1 putative copper resistance D [Pseudomonas mandelii JR-1]MDI1328993.1 copper homeostasis membrane protein CopD [Pseudomonas sp.]MDO8407484.1 copper homeostasis membrane protein CopD [Pseudomonas sp.]NMZ79078.1 copper homeostasis membrane protein CopD [Pseudomonas mandelii]OOL34175.1 copper resistance protein CopD [Pseudomonas sp. FSL W5-0299]
MSDSIGIALRFGLYVDLMLLLGLPLFGLYSLKGRERVSGAVLPFRLMLAGTAALGLLLSIASMVVMASAMSGETAFAELRPHLEMMVLETDMGLAWVVRIVALVVGGLAVMLNHRAPGVGLLVATIAGGIALASLAWNGHGAMDEGIRRVWHFTTDILHLLAAGVWLGALVALALMAKANVLQTEERIRLLARAVTRFEVVGALIVVVITVTGVVNYLFIVGLELDDLFLSTYGILLFIKVTLFAGMLVLAALNRFHLGPFLQRSLRNGQYWVAANALRRSVVMELAAAVLIVGLVAWLGTLSPEMEMAAE